MILDGAQGAGAIPVDVVKLGCAAYAASGQKWLCGADGTGLLYLAPGVPRPRADDRALLHQLRGRLARVRVAAQARRAPPRHARRCRARALAFSAASLAVLREADLAAVLARGPALAATLAERLAAHGRTVAPRGHTTLVAFEDDDPEAHARPPARRRRARPQPPRHPARARLRRRVVERGRPRAPARRALAAAAARRRRSRSARAACDPDSSPAARCARRAARTPRR